MNMDKSSVHCNPQINEKILNFKVSSRLDLRKYELTESDLQVIIQEVIIKKQCAMLWLGDNHLTSQSIKILASAVSNNSTLDGLSLCNNNITDKDVFHFANALSSQKANLKRLALTSNNITDEGVQYISNMLKTNHTLTQLWLGRNKITDNGVKLLTDTLAHHNRTLYALSLSWNNQVTDSSVDFFIDMLEYNQTLKIICLSNCNLSDAGKSKLRTETKSRKEFYVDL